MKQLLSIVLLILPCLVKAQQDNNSKGIRWSEGLTWDRVKEKAKQENKFIFVDVYATWCVPCKKMDKEVYPDKEVGDIVNDKFISVKVQMDQTNKDNEQVKEWYAIAKSFDEQYNIEGYPSFLFFSPDGKLAYKELGIKSTDQFIEVVKEALTDPEARYQNSIQKFKKGQLEYSAMPDLVKGALKKEDQKQAIEIAKRYKTGYLDKLNDEQVFTFENLSLISLYHNFLVNSHDRYFKFFLIQQNLADSLLKRKVSKGIVTDIVQKEEINDKIYKDGKPVIVQGSNWSKMQKAIKKKYSWVNNEKMILDAQISYYDAAKDWPKYIEYVLTKVEKYGVAATFPWHSNQIVASFIHCNDSLTLVRAASWIESYVTESFIQQGWENMVKNEQDSMAISSNNDFSNYACLLYKAGRREEAIKWVEWHIKLFEVDLKRKQPIFSDLYSYKKIILERMKKGELIDDTWAPVWFN